MLASLEVFGRLSYSKMSLSPREQDEEKADFVRQVAVKGNRTQRGGTKLS